ncbi:MAG: hypothetical protein WCP82_00955 [Alphaproteobacteria bacterium]|jgi:hypothetical protein
MDSATNAWNDRRANHRQRALLRGRICYGSNAEISIDCAIRNINAQGALLVVSGEQPLPTNFTLIHVTEGTSFDSHGIWRHGAYVGVTIGDRHDLKGPIDAQLRTLHNI